MKDIKKKKIYKHIIIFLSTLIILDFLYTFINNYLYPYNFTEKNIFYGLTYKKNIDKHHFFNLYGKTRYCADINGFRTKCNKKNEEEYDIIFIGNIFTEGMDLIYEDTFVGHKYSFKIVVTETYDDGSGGKGDLYVDGSKVTDGKTKILWIYKDFFEFDGDQDDPDGHIKINRVNGAIRISGVPPVGNSNPGICPIMPSIFDAILVVPADVMASKSNPDDVNEPPNFLNPKKYGVLLVLIMVKKFSLVKHLLN